MFAEHIAQNIQTVLQIVVFRVTKQIEGPQGQNALLVSTSAEVPYFTVRLQLFGKAVDQIIGYGTVHIGLLD